MIAPLKPLSVVSLALAVTATLGAGCGAASRRDLGAIPQRQITYDDMCHLQDYFDQRAAAHAQPFRAENEQSTETSRVEPDERGQPRRVTLGEGTYRVTDHSDRTRFNRLLHDEYHRLPTQLHLTRPEAEVQVHVGWWQSGTIRRLRPDLDIDLTVNGETHSLPFNPCVGEFLFGDAPYAMRRNVLDAERARAHGEIPRQYLPDGGPPEDTAPDAPVPSDASVANVPPSDATVTDATVTSATVTDATVTDATVTDDASRDTHREPPHDAGRRRLR